MSTDNNKSRTMEKPTVVNTSEQETVKPSIVTPVMATGSAAVTNNAATDDVTTATSSQNGFSASIETGDNDDIWNGEGDDLDDPLYFPLLKYTTLTGVPRKSNSNSSGGSLETSCTCTAVAQVLLHPAEAAHESANINGPNATGATSRSPNQNDDGDEVNLSAFLSSDLWKQPHFLMAMGWQTGTVSLVSVQSGVSVRLEQNSAVDSSVASAASTGSTVSKLHLREQGSWGAVGGTADSNPPPTVDVSMDSTGTLLAAIDEGGTCCIWELKYTPSYQKQQIPISAAAGIDLTTTDEPVPMSALVANTTTAPAAPSRNYTPAANKGVGGGGGGGGMFSNFMTALTGLPPSPEAEASSSRNTAPASSPGIIGKAATPTRTVTTPCLAASIASTSRITYPTHWKGPTCMVLDPAHKKKSTKSFLVGFSDGRLMLTKRGGLFQRRNDTILYQGGSESPNYQGIECVTWRGNLVAWADESGMKLLDIDTLTRIAHIDRPTGARASLYPSLTPDLLRPHLVFETASKLLVAWGDCLMNMELKESPTQGEGTSVAMRRTVQCSMAWELDCVASGVVPLDAEHVVVLGVIPPNDDDEQDGQLAETGPQDDADGAEISVATSALPRSAANELEVQIVSRSDGTIQYADVLPQNVVSNMWLESSFALPRMGNNMEWNEYKAWSGRIDDSAAFDLTLLTGGSMDSQGGMTQAPNETRNSNSNNSSLPNTGGANSTQGPNSTGRWASGQDRTRNKFVDSHLQWNLKSITYDDDDDYRTNDDNEKSEEDANKDDDDNTVDSDDYGFVFRPLELLDDTASSLDLVGTAPVMVVASGSDLVKTTLSNVDDAVEHALVTQNRPALALKRGLQHRRQLRRYRISELAENYLEAVLYLPPDGQETDASSSILSLRRMRLAIQAMPALLGDQLEQWTKWANELEKLPGALFLLRSHLPVRDPVLPPQLYEQVLRGMLKEYERLVGTGKKNGTIALDKEAAHHVLESLLAWGPTTGLKEYIKLYQFSRRKGDKSAAEPLKRVENALQRRYLQTAAGYLKFPVSQASPDEQVPTSSAPQYDAHNDDSKDTLFSLETIYRSIAHRTPLIARKVELGDQSIFKTESTLEPNNRVCLEAMARLRMMQCRYELALQAYLAIAARHSPVTMTELESSAIDAVQKGAGKRDRSIRIEDTSYEFVLGLIENHHLHRSLLDPEFIVKGRNAKTKELRPLLALLRLVGLSRAGEFLMEHCVAPEMPSNTGPSLYETMGDSKESHRPETLPMDLVAAQLESSPALMHWYLHLVFAKKPELYVKFSNNSIPPDAVTELHRKHFQLYLDFAGESRNSAEVLSGVETYKVETVTTPLLSFLKAALPLGGISPIDVRRQLETIRSEGSTYSDDDNDENAEGEDATSPTFALELAYIVEHYGDESEDESKAILNLLLEGAKSIMLGVAYAQRQREYSSLLWDRLIDHCLSPNETESESDGDGMLFGALLEAAALSGADLARLVAKIPPGMVVEGLRPRLVAAVADYRLKVDIHQAATSAASDEEIALVREVAHRSRRGARFVFSKLEERKPQRQAIVPESKFKNDDADMDQPSILPKNLRPIERWDRHNPSFSLPLR